MSDEISISVASVGDEVQVAIVDGPASVKAILTAAQAGALGGLLLSAAHAPLPTDVTYLVQSGSIPQDDRPVPKPPPDPPELTVPRLQASAAAERVPVSYAPAIVIRPWEWEVPAGVAARIADHGFSENEVRAAASEPDLSKPAPDGQARNHEAGEIGAIVRGNLIIGVYSAGHADVVHGTPRAKSGGRGRRMPSTFAEARRMLTDLGFVIDECRGSGHPLLTHPQHPGWQQTLARTTGDSRSWRNAFRDIRVATGIDVTADRTVNA